MKQNSQVKIQNETPLVSVIVPVYKTEKYLRRCLDSIIWQSYKNIELICVDDASPDGCAQILQEYRNWDSRVKIITHKENKGLFNARVSGIAESSGRYVLFIDSDDYISKDWIRLLVEKALNAEADIVIGQWMFVQINGDKTYENLDPTRNPLEIEGDEVLNTFMGQQGSCFSWHLVWNKLYSMELWLDAFNTLKQFADDNVHFTMCEDIAFSSAVWCRAKKVSNVTEGALYYYCKNENQSTKVEGSPLESVEKKIADVLRAFDFMKNQLELAGKFDGHKKDFEAWKISYAKIYNDSTKSIRNYEKNIRKYFSIDKDIPLESNPQTDSYFYSIESQAGNIFDWLEDIKNNICDKNIKIVSFDIFDTLLLRPFFIPSDLFYLLNDEFNRLINSNTFIDFAKLRIEAEQICRDEIRQTYRAYEDITLDEIYYTLNKYFNFSTPILEQIKQRELEYEIKYCYPRQMGKQLYELAKQQGKTIIFTSDMYLPENIVEKILNLNGYTEGSLFLSSSLRLSKGTQSLYKYIQRKYKLSPEHFIHIGDNWHSDIESAKAAGWKAFHLAKATDMLRNGNPGIYGGEAFNSIYNNCGNMQDMNNAFKSYLGLRCAAALIANKLYDNPYINIRRDTDYDANPYRIGYAALGPYLLAITNWIIAEVKTNRYSSVQFVARDGYLPMCAYNIFKKHDASLPDANYLYVSRKSLLFTDIVSLNDIYSISAKLNFDSMSPRKLDNILRHFYKPDTPSVEKLLKLSRPLLDYNFKDKVDFIKILNILSGYIDECNLADYNKKIKNHFQTLIPRNSVMFDIGYNGRSESSLSKLLGYPLNSLYVHANTQMLDDRKRTSHFSNLCFYDYKPRITGVIREYAFMKTGPSVVGYKFECGNTLPVFEKYHPNVAEKFMTNCLQRAALDFIKDYLHFFYEDCAMIPFRNTDMALPFEYYLHYSKMIDRQIFRCVEFEDDLGFGKKVNAYEFWNNDLYAAECVHESSGNGNAVYNTKVVEVDRVQNFSKFKKGLYYFLFDNKAFRKKLRKK